MNAMQLTDARAQTHETWMGHDNVRLPAHAGQRSPICNESLQCIAGMQDRLRKTPPKYP
jgi:hypothetical protein